MDKRQATENGDIAALERAWDEAGQNRPTPYTRSRPSRS